MSTLLQVVSKHGTEYMSRHMPSMHRSLAGLTRGDAQLHFIRDVCLPPTAHNLHFYKLKKRKQDTKPTAWLAICPTGIEIYEVGLDLLLGHRNLISWLTKPRGKIWTQISVKQIF